MLSCLQLQQLAVLIIFWYFALPPYFGLLTCYAGAAKVQALPTAATGYRNSSSMHCYCCCSIVSVLAIWGFFLGLLELQHISVSVAFAVFFLLQQRYIPPPMLYVFTPVYHIQTAVMCIIPVICTISMMQHCWFKWMNYVSVVNDVIQRTILLPKDTTKE